MFVCYCVVRKYVGVVIIYAPLTVGSSPCMCSCAVCRSVCVDFMNIRRAKSRSYNLMEIYCMK
jgi:hypothetical protein